MTRFFSFLIYLTCVEIVFTMDKSYSYYNTCNQVDCAGNPNNACCLCNTIDDCKVSDPEMANCTDLDNGYGQVCVCTHPYAWDGVSCVTITKEYQSSPWSAEKPIVYHEYKLFGKARILYVGGGDVIFDNGTSDHENGGNNNDAEIPCEPGTYLSSSSPDPGSDSNMGPNIAKCKPCGVGYYQDRFGMNSCVPCGTGKFQNETGKIECKNCDVFCTECNSFNGSCFSCIEDPGIERKGNACVCKDGYYQVQENPIKQCRPCHPLCATCFGPSSSECDSCQNSLRASDNSCVIYCDSLPGYYTSENSCEGLLLF